MNDELRDANASVVSNLLVIAPYSADLSYRTFGIWSGEKPRQYRSANKNLDGHDRRVVLFANSLTTSIDQVSKVVITSATFVRSGAQRRKVLSTGIFSLKHSPGVKCTFDP